MLHLTRIVLLLLLSPLSVAQEIPDSWPDWLRDAMAREATTDKVATLEIADEAISGKLRGAFIDQPELDDNSWYFSLDVAAESPMECWVFPEGIDTATSTANIADSLVNFHADNLGGVNSKNLYHVSQQVNDGVPTIALEWLYNAGKEGEKRVGLVKLRSALVADANVLCAHSAMGFRQSFADAFDYLLANLSVQRAQSPYYESLHEFSVNGSTFGFARILMFEDADGDTEIRSADAMLMPTDAANVSASDSVTVEYSYPDGRLINQIAYSIENESVVVNAQMGRGETGWSITGTAQGKDIATTIETEHEVLTTLGQLNRTKELLQSEQGGDAEFHVWIPSVDPVALTTAKVNVNADATGSLVTGPIVFETLFDQNGNLERGQTDLGGVAMQVTKVWERGKL